MAIETGMPAAESAAGKLKPVFVATMVDKAPMPRRRGIFRGRLGCEIVSLAVEVSFWTAVGGAIVGSLASTISAGLVREVWSPVPPGAIEGAGYFRDEGTNNMGRRELAG